MLGYFFILAKFLFPSVWIFTVHREQEVAKWSLDDDIIFKGARDNKTSTHKQIRIMEPLDVS